MTSFSSRAAEAVASGLFAACAPARSPREPAASPAAVTSSDLQHSTEPIEVVLQRKVPGLVVTRTPDGGIALQIRGARSFTGDALPLYVLNGLPFEPGPNGALSGIDPNEIDTVRVLKGPDAAIYGSQGANGAIVITTKMPGRKPGRP